MTRQTVHNRISKKGKPFTAGSKVMPVPKLKPDTILMVANMPYFRKLLAPLFNLVTEARIDIGDGEIKIIEMDPANVALLNYKIMNHNGISIRSEKPVRIIINTSNFKKAVKDIKTGTEVNFEFDKVSNKLLMVTQNMKAEIPLLSIPENKDVKLPDLKTKFAFTMKGQDLLDDFKKLSAYADVVILESGPKGITLSAHGDATAAPAIITLDSSKMENSKSKYSLTYLMKIAPILNKNSMARLKWATDYPLIIDVEHQNFIISMILAPRVEND